MFLYAIKPFFADIHKIGMWSGDKRSLHNRYCTPYGEFDVTYIDIGQTNDLLAAEKKLHAYLRKKGKWLIGEIFQLCYDEIRQYCTDIEPTFELLLH